MQPAAEPPPPSATPAIAIPLIDIRSGSPIDLVTAQRDRVRRLMALTRAQLGLVTRVLLPLLYPVMDFFSRRWLKKSANPYYAEIAAMQKAAGTSGIITQNTVYEWTCTAGALKTPSAAAPRLVRVMDWMVKDMGEHLVVAHQSGKAGEFYNVTVPGLSGVFNGVAKGRFAATINQAPMKRSLFGGAVGDLVRNRLRLFRSRALPPAHLLRRAFETAASYQEAKEMLTATPVAAPVIFTLTGVKEGEGCVIERLEDKAVVREMNGDRVFATNHFQSSLNGVGWGWTPRGFDNHARAEAAAKIAPAAAEQGFDWFQPPLANKFSRLAMTADAASGELSLVGTAGEKIVTQVFRVAG